jgi:hemoglobin-like flavoprotein
VGCARALRSPPEAGVTNRDHAFSVFTQAQIVEYRIHGILNRVKVDERDIELFNDSLERCTQNRSFMERFYDLFVASSPEVMEKFKFTDFRRQRRMLKASLYMLVFAAEGRPEGFVHMEEIAKKHGAGNLNVKPEMYDLWIESLLKTVSEFDRGFNPEVERAWRNMLHAGISYMKSHSGHQ